MLGWQILTCRQAHGAQFAITLYAGTDDIAWRNVPPITAALRDFGGTVRGIKVRCVCLPDWPIIRPLGYGVAQVP